MSPATCVGVAAALAALWLFDLFALKTPVLTPYVTSRVRLPALTPIYAFWWPAISARVLWFVAAALVLVGSAVHLCRPERMPRRVFVAALVALATVLPLALFALRQGLSALGQQFLIYPNEEVYFDALSIKELGPFLAQYVEQMPSLSLHGRHFPPGNAMLLYAVGQWFGTGPLPAGIAVLACFVLAIFFVYRALARASGEVAARQGAVLLLASPSMLDFACTSMDAVFLMFASLAWWLATGVVDPLRRDEPSTGARRFVAPALTGVALFVATCFSFSSFPLGLAIGLAISIAGRRSIRAASEALAAIGASYVIATLALYFATGFALWSCLAEAKRSNFEFMSRVIGRYAHDLYGVLCYGNAAAFLIGSGVALVAAAWTGWSLRKSPWSGAFLLTLCVMSFGGIYFMETERIWLFAIPWLVAIAVSHSAFTSGSLRALLAVGLAQALVMEALLFTLW